MTRKEKRERAAAKREELTKKIFDQFEQLIEEMSSADGIAELEAEPNPHKRMRLKYRLDLTLHDRILSRIETITANYLRNGPATEKSMREDVVHLFADRLDAHLSSMLGEDQ